MLTFEDEKIPTLATGAALTTVIQAPLDARTINYRPDQLGLISFDGTSSRYYNLDNQLINIGNSTLVYDFDGNQVVDQNGNRSIYDPWGHLTSMARTNQQPATYRYDGLGRLIAQVVRPSAFVYVNVDLYYNVQGQVLDEAVGDSGTMRVAGDHWNVWSPAGGNLLTQTSSWFMTPEGSRGAPQSMNFVGLYALQDMAGNVIADFRPPQVGYLEQGAVLARYRYDAMGQVTFLNAGFGANPFYTTAGGATYLLGGNRYDGLTKMVMVMQSGGSVSYNPSQMGFVNGIGAAISNYATNISNEFSQDWFAALSNVSAGMGDTISMGLTQRFRALVGYDDAVNTQSAAYGTGQVAGMAVNIGLGFANPCTLLQSGTTMGLLAYRGLQVVNGVQAAGGVFNFGANIAQGNYGMAALDALGILGNVGQMLRACFEPDVPTETQNGTKIIDDVIPLRDHVLSRNEHDPDGPVEWKLVLRKFERWAFAVKLHLEEGRVLGTTSEHPFYKQGAGWVPCSELLPGDRIWTKELRWVSVVEVFNTQELRRVINLQVQDFATFFVGGEDWGFSVWAHNTYTKNFDATNFGQSVAANIRGGTIGRYWNILGEYAQAVAANVLTGFGATVRNVSKTAGSLFDLVASYAGNLANIEAKFSLPSKLGTSKFNRLVQQMIAGTADAAASGSTYVVWSFRTPSIATLRRIENAVGTNVFNQTQFVDGAQGLYKWARFFFR